ncbi:amino acid ABC transporter ATP-binding protein [Bifidobacterium sp. MA2]|uniref:Amino acid ABC transporter ATP-binding protein n=1 Tax=Bifidobacterium santillanense TaxID=2809028 RepID=A0ABS5UNI5_9BIFI|nr:amino acid ABC transporter ATP-binding protein [Bifidobacterium santillanense]MBT1172439.1 amino acid ABC transporter ATP-binding protein [Bifidobacterium santillanense]
MIKIRGLVKTYGKNTVLDGIDLDIEKGEVVALIGPSGTGKSTFLRSINLLEKPDAGELTIDGHTYDLAKISKKDTIAIRRSTAMVFQQFNLFKNRTALENVMEGLTVVKKVPRKEARERALAELRNVGLEAWQDHYPQHLSGGQQQRVGIARALSMDPQLLLLDEPTSALDPERVREVQETIDKAAKEGNTMLLVSHEMGFVRQIATRVLFIDGGKVVEQGAPEQVFSAPKTPRLREFLASFNEYANTEADNAPARTPINVIVPRTPTIFPVKQEQLI